MSTVHNESDLTFKMVKYINITENMTKHKLHQKFLHA